MLFLRPFLILLTLVVALAGCQDEPPPSASDPQEAPVPKDLAASAPDTPQTPVASPPLDRTPPRPPLKEDFQGAPQMSLFPRVGDFQPPPEEERHAYWRTFIDHLVKITGVAENSADGSRGWVFRSIDTIDSVGYFSPIAVEPNQTYQVSFTLKATLPEGASAGIGVLEFDTFFWIGEQYGEEIYDQHYRGVHEGRRLTGQVSGLQSFSFTTGPDTRMIHLVLFREGAHDRSSLMFDDIEIR